MVDEVEILVSPSQWLSGTKALAYFGPINASGYCLEPSSFGRLWRRLSKKLAREAHALGANSVVGAELQVDPFREIRGRSVVYLQVIGTAAKLEPLF